MHPQKLDTFGGAFLINFSRYQAGVLLLSVYIDRLSMVAHGGFIFEIDFVTMITRKRFRLGNGYFNYTHFRVALLDVVAVV